MVSYLPCALRDFYGGLQAFPGSLQTLGSPLVSRAAVVDDTELSD